MRRWAAAAVASTLVGVGAAHAEPPLPLGPVRLPPTLHMRPFEARVAAEDAGRAPAAASEVDADLDPLAPPRPTVIDELRGQLADLSEQVIFRFSLGFGLDGGQPSDDRLLASGAPLDERLYARVRMYGFGDAVIGSRGLGVASLSSYFAASFRFDETDRLTGPVPSIHDSERYADPPQKVEDIFVRSAYAEAVAFADDPRLRPLRLRGGRQFRYGPAIAHFDGLTVGYDTASISVAGFGGYRVSLYDDGQFDAPIAGADARVDLYRLRRIPVVLTGSVLRFDDVSHAEGGLALQWSRDLLARASLRWFDGAVARQRLGIHARLSQVTTVSADVENRTDDDWIYDLIVTGAGDATDPRRYLDLGPTLPRVYLNLRAGTVLLDNIDLLLRAGAAIEHADEGAAPSAFSSSYLEAGGAFEVRVRRAIAFGSSILARRHAEVEAAPVMDLGDGPDPLPTWSGGLGERSFVETGGTLSYRQGGGQLSAGAEAYMRIYRVQTPYEPARVDDREVRGGGRFTVEGRAGERLRLRAEYDVSSAIEAAPELRGLKSLRVIAEGRF